MRMIFAFTERRSDSPFVERIWRADSVNSGDFLSVAASHWEMVVSKLNGQTTLTVRGPETKVTPMQCLAGGEWFGIRFKLGTIMPHLPGSQLVNHGITLPLTTGEAGKSFWLNGSAWQFPEFENADTFVAWLEHDGLLAHEPVVEAAMRGQLNAQSLRTVQRRFVRATGLTHATVRQIERARKATLLLREGTPIPDVIRDAGYFDQPHLHRSLMRFIGQTPVQLLRDRSTQLSFLYKTESDL